MDLLDYRELPEDEPFDKIASVGMFEHVGRAQLPAYFAKIHRLLKPGGLLMNHGITAGGTRNHQLGAGMGDFIERYIFPGGELLHVSRVLEATERGGARGGRRREPAPALRAHAVGLERLRSRRSSRAARSVTAETRGAAPTALYLAGSAMAFERGWISLHQMLVRAAPPATWRSGPMRGAQSAFPFNRGYIVPRSGA